MAGAVAAKPLEMNGVVETEAAGLVDGVTRLVRAPVHLEALPAEAKHLGHEREPVERRVRAQRRQDILTAPDLDPLAGP
jgi:hypothetical protein